MAPVASVRPNAIQMEMRIIVGEIHIVVRLSGDGGRQDTGQESNRMKSSNRLKSSVPKRYGEALNRTADLQGGFEGQEVAGTRDFEDVRLRKSWRHRVGHDARRDDRILASDQEPGPGR